jgi:hypothetical protein
MGGEGSGNRRQIPRALLRDGRGGGGSGGPGVSKTNPPQRWEGEEVEVEGPLDQEWTPHPVEGQDGEDVVVEGRGVKEVGRQVDGT